MGRNQQVFVGLVAFMTAAIAAGVVWVGPELVALAYFDSQRDEPMLVIDLSGRSASTRGPEGVGAPLELAALLEQENAQIIGIHERAHTLEGRPRDEFAYLLGGQMRQGSDIVRVMTTSEFRALTPELTVASFGPGLDDARQWRSTLVLLLVAERASVNALVGLFEELEGSSGNLVWDEPSRVLIGGEPWNRLALIDFASEGQALDWLRQPEVADARAIANSRAQELLISVYSR